MLNGALGGATGLAGIIGIIWCGMRDWSPPEQRAVFQPVGVSVFLMLTLWFGGTGMVGKETIGLFLIGLPALPLGTGAGLRTFGKLEEAGFRRVVMVLLLLSALSLVLLGR